MAPRNPRDREAALASRPHVALRRECLRPLGADISRSESTSTRQMETRRHASQPAHCAQLTLRPTTLPIGASSRLIGASVALVRSRKPVPKDHGPVLSAACLRHVSGCLEPVLGCLGSPLGHLRPIVVPSWAQILRCHGSSWAIWEPFWPQEASGSPGYFAREPLLQFWRSLGQFRVPIFSYFRASCWVGLWIRF